MLEFTDTLRDIRQSVARQSGWLRNLPWPGGTGARLTYTLAGFRPHGPLDMKRWPEYKYVSYFVVDDMLLRYDSPGNILFGSAMANIGLSLQVANFGAGLFQEDRKPYWKLGDDPVDRYWIETGYYGRH